MKVNKFYQIGQVCKLTGLPHSTIRFWEKNFPRLTPTRSSGGHRYYNTMQVDLIQYLKKLLYEEGYTIEGAKKRLSDEKVSSKLQLKEPIIQEAEPAAKDEKTSVNEIITSQIKSELQEILSLLNKSIKTDE